MVRVGRSGFMYNSYLCNGKEDRPLAYYDYLSVSNQSANRLCSNLLTVGPTKPKH